MTDNNETDGARSETNGELQELTAHTLESGSGGSGIICKVELRYSGRDAGNANRASLRPVFSGTLNGDVHDPGDVLTSSFAWIPWIDITNDTNAPVSWNWTDVTNLDLDVTSINSDQLYVSKVQLRVHYTP